MAVLKTLGRWSLIAGLFVATLLGSLFLTSKLIIQGQQEVVVPDLVGRDTVYALELLTTLGLNMKVSGFQWSDTVPKNFIAAQDPPAGARLKPDRDVRVVISRGSKMVPVPNLVGKNLREAEVELLRSGLQLRDVCRAPAPTLHHDRIIAQTPLPLQEVERGTGVDLLVSTGSRHPGIAMPELRYSEPEAAIGVLRSLGITNIDVRQVFSPGEPLGVVIQQRPRSGYRVGLKDKVVIAVNRRPQPSRPQRHLILLGFLVPEGYFKKEIKLYQASDSGKEPLLLYNGIHRPGEYLEWLVWGESPGEFALVMDGVLQPLEQAPFVWPRPRPLQPYSSRL